jgi:hypothetical protein
VTSIKSLREYLWRRFVEATGSPSASKAAADGASDFGNPNAPSASIRLIRRRHYSRMTMASTSKSMGSIASLGTGTRVCAGSASPNIFLTLLVNTSSLDIS